MMRKSLRRKLSDLVEIKPGYSFRSKIEHDPDGDFIVIQPSNVGAAGEVNLEELPRVGDVKPRSYHRVDPETVLFVAYGPRNRAYCFEELPSNTIASSTFYLLKSRDSRVRPGYLAWYLNQQPAQAYVEALRSGVSVQMIRRDALGGMEIPVPPISLQEKVAHIAYLAAEEERLLRELIERRRLFIHGSLLNKIHNS